jgi:hypothetical protein
MFFLNCIIIYWITLGNAVVPRPIPHCFALLGQQWLVHPLVPLFAANTYFYAFARSHTNARLLIGTFTMQGGQKRRRLVRATQQRFESR